MADTRAYRRLVYRLPGTLEDDLVADLWAAGTLGVESSAADDHVRVTAWFPARDIPGEPAPALAELERRWRERGAEILGETTVPEQDWLAPWRELAQPIPVGRAFLLDPREPEPDEAIPSTAAEDRVRLRLPARRAFGTGSHESTRLAVELLEDVFAEGRWGRPPRVLDVGTGTGVLAFVALHLGAAAVVGFDVDPVAIFQARANSLLNPFTPLPRWFAGGVAALAGAPEPGGAGGVDVGGFDLVVANILPERILPEIEAVTGQLAPRAELIFSGILESQGQAVLGRLAELGLVCSGSRTEGEWVAYRARRGGD